MQSTINIIIAPIFEVDPASEVFWRVQERGKVQVLREPNMGDINQRPLIHEATKELRQVRICYLINLLKETLVHTSVTLG